MESANRPDCSVNDQPRLPDPSMPLLRNKNAPPPEVPANGMFQNYFHEKVQPPIYPKKNKQLNLFFNPVTPFFCFGYSHGYLNRFKTTNSCNCCFSPEIAFAADKISPKGRWCLRLVSPSDWGPSPPSPPSHGFSTEFKTPPKAQGGKWRQRIEFWADFFQIATKYCYWTMVYSHPALPHALNRDQRSMESPFFKFSKNIESLHPDKIIIIVARLCSSPSDGVVWMNYPELFFLTWISPDQTRDELKQSSSSLFENFVHLLFVCLHLGVSDLCNAMPWNKNKILHFKLCIFRSPFFPTPSSVTRIFEFDPSSPTELHPAPLSLCENSSDY